MTLVSRFLRGSAFDEDKLTVYLVVPPRPIQRCVYRCGAHFHTEHVLSLYRDATSYGLVYVSGSMCLIATVIAGDDGSLDIQPRSMRRTVLQKKQRKGGQSAQRIGRLRDEMHHNYMTGVLERIQVVFAEHPVVGLVLAGPSVKKEALRKRLTLDVPLLAVLTLSDRLSMEQLKPHLKPVLESHRYRDEATQLKTLFEQTDDVRFVYGTKAVKRALAQRRLETLYVHQRTLDAKQVDVDQLQAYCQLQRTTLVVLHLYNAQAQHFIEGYGGYVGWAWY